MQWNGSLYGTDDFEREPERAPAPALLYRYECPNCDAVFCAPQSQLQAMVAQHILEVHPDFLKRRREKKIEAPDALGIRTLRRNRQGVYE
jgi:hypothetical protein